MRIPFVFLHIIAPKHKPLTKLSSSLITISVQINYFYPF